MARIWRQATTELIIGSLALELLLFVYQLYGDRAAGSQLGKLAFWGRDASLGRSAAWPGG